MTLTWKLGQTLTELASVINSHIILTCTILFLYIFVEFVIETVFISFSLGVLDQTYFLVYPYSLHVILLLSHEAKIIIYHWL